MCFPQELNIYYAPTELPKEFEQKGSFKDLNATITTHYGNDFIYDANTGLLFTTRNIDCTKIDREVFNERPLSFFRLQRETPDYQEWARKVAMHTGRPKNLPKFSCLTL